jgi:hypothetical protein
MVISVPFLERNLNNKGENMNNLTELTVEVLVSADDFYINYDLVTQYEFTEFIKTNRRFLERFNYKIEEDQDGKTGIYII